MDVALVVVVVVVVVVRTLGAGAVDDAVDGGVPIPSSLFQNSSPRCS